MKFIVIGLGHFGGPLATRLTALGNEVIGVDKRLDLIETYKERVTHVMALDATDRMAVKVLPLEDADAVLVCIGEDEGANMLCTALMRELGVRRLISRSVNDLHRTILEAMHVDAVISPEEETAVQWARKLHTGAALDALDLGENYGLAEVSVPASFEGKSIQELGIRERFGVIVLTVIRYGTRRNLLGTEVPERKVLGVAEAGTVLGAGEHLVAFGHNRDLRRMVQELR